MINGYYQPNHPVYQNGYYFVQHGSNWEVGFQAKQTQTNTVFFKMPIEIKISFTTGSDTTIRVMNDVNNQLFNFMFTRQPSAVQFDPNNQIVLKSATLQQIAPVPVELTSLSASANGNIVILKWTTATEINNKGFEIQRKVSPKSSPKSAVGLILILKMLVLYRGLEHQLMQKNILMLMQYRSMENIYIVSNKLILMAK